VQPQSRAISDFLTIRVGSDTQTADCQFMKKKLREYIDEEGRRQITMAESEKPEDELCDFCSNIRKPFKVYPCKDFETLPGVISRGEWNACSKCAELIDADDREGLLDRCQLMMNFEGIPGTREGLRVLHDLFFKNRIT